MMRNQHARQQTDQLNELRSGGWYQPRKEYPMERRQYPLDPYYYDEEHFGIPQKRLRSHPPLVKHVTDPNELENYRVYFKDGQIVDHHARQFNCDDCIFVVDLNGNMYIHEPLDGFFHHSSFVKGMPVLAAGEIKFFDGRIVSLNNKSGHYKPDQESLDLPLSFFHEAGVRIEPEAIERFSPDQIIDLRDQR